MMVTTHISVGELIDKVTILRIKAFNIGDAAKQANVSKELKELEAVVEQLDLPDIKFETHMLHCVNQQLWDIEDGLRRKEMAQEFDEEFIRLARAVYYTNDERADLKKAINVKVGSELIEEKSYEQYR